MGKPSKAVLEFMSKYKIDSDEIWEVHGTTWVVKHKALERVAVEVGIVWEKPELKVCDMASGFCAVLIGAKLGDHAEYSFGEASPKNNKNSYPVAMAEKRAKDRVILKLLVCSGELYSDVDDIPPPRDQNDDAAIPDEDTITRDDGIQVLTVDAQRPIFSELTKEIATCDTVDECKRWKVTARKRASRLSEHWRKILNDIYLKQLRAIEAQDADAYIEGVTG